MMGTAGTKLDDNKINQKNLAISNGQASVSGGTVAVHAEANVCTKLHAQGRVDDEGDKQYQS